jgi:hypothetical protein
MHIYLQNVRMTKIGALRIVPRGPVAVECQGMAFIQTSKNTKAITNFVDQSQRSHQWNTNILATPEKIPPIAAINYMANLGMSQRMPMPTHLKRAIFLIE